MVVSRCFVFLQVMVLMAATSAQSVRAASEGHADGTAVDGHAPLHVDLVADAVAVTPSDRLRVGLWIHLDPGWHIYWQQPGAAGFATQVTWQAADASMSPLRWPAPEVFRESDGVVTYGYAGETLLWADATLSDSVAGTATVVAQLDYLACNIICSPGQATVRRTFPVGQATLAADADSQALFARYQHMLPVPPAAAGITMAVNLAPATLHPGEDFAADITFTPRAGDGNGAAIAFRREPFVPDAMVGLAVHVVGARAAGPEGAAQLSLKGHVAADANPTAALALSGIVALEGPAGPLQPMVLQHALHLAPATALGSTRHAGTPATKPLATAAGAAAPFAGAAQAAVPASDGVTLARAIALALLGGLILNLMPCVLPVLALKVVGMAHIRQGGHGGRRVAAHGLAYTAGVVLTLVALASIVCALRAAGTAVGWGFQFQEPWFVATVAGVLVLFALNCFGVFEIYVGDAGLGSRAQRAHGLQRSAFDGVLAVVLATPCSAPFLGTAVAFALQQSAALIYLIFVAIGVGLAAPYVILTALPQGLRFVPRPGNWMLHLKTLLGFGLLVTATWLVWVMGRFTGVDGMAQLLLVLLATALGAWLFGHASSKWPQRSLPLFVAFLATLGGGGFWGLRQTLATGTDSTAGTHGPGTPANWAPYTQAAAQAALAAGQPVFVDFTADWCLTCKYNEQNVLIDKAVRRAFADKEVLCLRADWTRRDEAIRLTLAHFGRAGVPMYLLFNPETPQAPQLLPELLSVGQLGDALSRLP